MGKLAIFNFITLNGFYKDGNEGTSWHQHGEEEGQFAVDSMKSDSILLFGRVTYEHMVSYWPTKAALQNSPALAKGMNEAEKIVFSRTLKKAEWKNTTLVSNNIIEEIKKAKKGKKDLTILGSGSIVSQCAEAGIIDEYSIMIDPVALGSGTAIFHGMKKQLNLKLTATRSFRSGVMLLTYQPA